MGEVGFAAGASHLPGLTGWFHKAPHDAQDRVRRAYDRLRDAIAAARLDALVVFANDHLANFRVSAYPDFVVCVSEVHRGPDDWFKAWLALEDYEVPGHPGVGNAIFEGLRARGFGVFASSELMRFDDNVSVPVAMLDLEKLEVPLVPVLQNCTVPPVPDEQRCYSLGQALADVVARDLSDDARIGLLGSGGLSHEPGGPRYFEIDEKFDRWFMELLSEGDHARILHEVTFDRMEEAGSGGTAELLSWMVVMGAIGQRPCEVLCCEAVTQWRCGCGVALWEL
jgi:aromatic ring-opening dioxygenase catalytic subunit (LigB family)